MSEGFSSGRGAESGGLLSAPVMRAYQSRFTIQSKSAFLSLRPKLYDHSSLAKYLNCFLPRNISFVIDKEYDCLLYQLFTSSKKKKLPGFEPRVKICQSGAFSSRPNLTKDCKNHLRQIFANFNYFSLFF